MQIEDKIKALEQCLEQNPNHPERTTIEADLRKLRDSTPSPLERVGERRTYERDTFDLREHNFNPK